MPYSDAPPISLPGVVIFEVNTQGRAEVKQALQSRRQNIRGCIIRRTQSKITQRSNDDSRESTNRVVFERTRGGSYLSDRSRIHSGMRRGQGRCMDMSIPDRTEYYQPTNIDDRQRRKLRPSKDCQIPSPQSPYRTPIPLSATTGLAEIPRDADHPRKGQPGGHSDETFTYELDQDMEEYLASINWDSWVNEMLE